MDRFLEVVISIHVKGSPDTLDLQATNIAKETYTALMFDPTLGLDFVIDLIPLGELDPDLSGEAQEPTMQLPQAWRIHYRHDYRNPEQ